MGSLRLNGATSGSTTITAPASGGDETIELSTVLASKLDLAGGKILQIVRATDSTARSTTSSSFVDANIDVTIAPQKSDSAIILIYSVCVENSGGSASGYAILQLTDSSNNAINGSQDARTGVSSAVRNQATLTLFAYATPATTSSVTYKARFVNDSGGNTVTLQNNFTTGELYAIEVSA